ncbi:MAG: head-tail connector protein [Pseudomonadota bacterium]
MSLTLIAPPAGEPISLDDLKAHLRVAHTDEDPLIAALGVAARQSVEVRAGLALTTQQWRLSLDAAPARPVYLPMRPLISVEAVTVVGPNDSVIHPPAGTFDIVTGLSGRIVRTGVWPRPAKAAGGVRIDFTAGWSSVDAVPAGILQAIRLLTAHFYENREAASVERTFAIPQTVDALLAPFREARL